MRVFAKNEIIATKLASEGIEAIRRITEINRIRCGKSFSNAWLLVSSEGSCAGVKLNEGRFYKVTPNTIINSTYWKPEWIIRVSGETYSMNPTYQLYVKNIDGTDYYVHDLSSLLATPFYRQIEIASDDAGESIRITSTVQWGQDVNPDEVKLVTVLIDPAIST